ncbi:MAG: hypothetical protein MI725_05750 [Pirellulales bacterium]|nr:hypothetical protein [Pirellulales bacterium]
MPRRRRYGTGHEPTVVGKREIQGKAPPPPLKARNPTHRLDLYLGRADIHEGTRNGPGQLPDLEARPVGWSGRALHLDPADAGAHTSGRLGGGSVRSDDGDTLGVIHQGRSDGVQPSLRLVHPHGESTDPVLHLGPRVGDHSDGKLLGQEASPTVQLPCDLEGAFLGRPHGPAEPMRGMARQKGHPLGGGERPAVETSVNRAGLAPRIVEIDNVVTDEQSTSAPCARDERRSAPPGLSSAADPSARIRA